FYLAIGAATLVGVLLSALGLDPVQLLIYTAVFYTLVTPFLILLILRIGNDKKIMNHNVNSKWSNFLGIGGFVVSFVITILYLSTFFY
ncbi:MAG: divalent metal cation transporter, partial [Candidatus Magasanikbacteria bacterium]|nr:divalent metal cation transporter [Candidatus Magasanikbacteria bacterium]